MKKIWKTILRRITAVFCAASLMLMMIPQGIGTVYADVGLQITVDGNAAPGTAVELGKNGAVSKDISLALSGDVSATYTATWNAEAGGEGLVTASVSGNLLTLAPVAGQYGQTTVRVTASEIKKTEASVESAVEGTAEAELTVKVYYQPSLTVLLAGSGGETIDAGNVPYGMGLKASVTESNGAEPSFGGRYQYHYSWKNSESQEVGTADSYTPANVGNYTLAVSVTDSGSGGESYLLTPVQPGSVSFTVAQAEPEVNLTFPEVTYGDDLSASGAQVTVSANVAGTVSFHGGASATVSQPGGSAVVGAAGILDVTSAGDKLLNYSFTPDDSNYKPLSNQEAAYTVKQRPITVNLIVPGKAFDNTTAVKASFAANNTDTDSTKIRYGLAGGSSMAGNDALRSWTLSGVTVAYGSVGNVEQDTGVNAVITSAASGHSITFDGDGGASGNYKITVAVPETSQSMITANRFSGEACYTLPAAPYTDSDGTAWYQGETVELIAGSGYTLAGTLTPDDNSSFDATAEVIPDNSAYTANVYVKRDSDGAIAVVTLAEKVGADNTAPEVKFIKATAADEVNSTGGIDFGRNDEIIYTFSVSDTESGVADDKIYYYITDSTTAVPPADLSSWSWTQASFDSTLGRFTFSVTTTKYGYVWTKAEDMVGNVSNPSNSVRALVIETGAPTVMLTPDSETDWQKKHIIEVTATDTPDSEFSGIHNISYQLTNQEDGTTVYDVPQKIEYDAPGTLSDIASSYKQKKEDVTFDDSRLDGEYLLTVTATDFCGNVSAEASCTLFFDTTPPVVEAVMNGGGEDGNGNFYYKADNCGVTVTIEDEHSQNGTKYSVSLSSENGNKTEPGLIVAETVVSGTDPAVVTFTAEQVAGALNDGAVTLTVSAVDGAKGEQNTAVEMAVSGMRYDGESKGMSASFVLDTAAPLVTKIEESGAPHDGRLWDGSDYYYSEATTLTYTVEDGNCGALQLEYGYTDAGGVSTDNASMSGTPVTAGTANVVEFTLSAEGKYTEITLSGTDLAGNPLAVVPDESQADWTEWDKASSGDNGVVLNYHKVIDKTSPVAELVYSSGDTDLRAYPNDDAMDGGRTAYYFQQDVAVRVAFEDGANPLDGKEFQVRRVSDGTPGGDVAVDEGKGFLHTETLSRDGRYYFEVSGADRAGNPVIVREQEPGAGNTPAGEGDRTNYAIVVDKTAPAVTFTIQTDASQKQLQTAYNNRYYFNKPFTANYTLEETNFDGTLITASYGYQDADNYMSAGVTAGSPIFGAGQAFSYTGSSDGVYILSLTGTDKAGNPVEIKGGSTTNIGNNPLQTAGNELTSYVIVVDTKAPALNVKVGDYYEADLTSDGYQVTANQPYRQEDSATLTYTGADKSPVSVGYELYSSILEKKTAKQEGESYEYHETGRHVFDGQQIFAIDSLSITDLAGNRIEAEKAVDGRVSNLIYLDTTAPRQDKLAPTVRLVAHESGQGRSQAGVDLYDGTVTVDAIITDPGFQDAVHGGTSSGLYAVYYEVLHNDSENWTSMMSGRVRSAGKSSAAGTVHYGSGKDYTAVGNEKLTGSDTLTFTFDASDFNYNDLSVRVWAEDNSGNVLSKGNVAVYRFGIDTTAPSIDVSYDNNDVRNGKYFKANRTATIVVRERNFDPANTRIVTQAGSGSWNYAAGSSANGDDDTWTCSVLYAEDGDYTLNVTARDLLGHDAGAANFGASAAPREFTVDKTAPRIEVSFDNNSAANGRYYKDPRTATILITEHNFEASSAQVNTTAAISEGSASVPATGGWSSLGDSNSAQVRFSEDGDYTMEIQFTDLAGNEAAPFSVSLFTVDRTPPKLEIGGVKDRTAYNGAVAPSITYHDINYDNTSAGVTITGYKHSSGENLAGTRADNQFGGSFICNNIAPVRDNDDVYTATGSVSDLAGNTTEATVIFSVNRFGSNYILKGSTKSLVDEYYTNQPQPLEVTEINVSALTEQEVTTSLNGEIVTLAAGRDYSVNVSNPGWVQSDYLIHEGNFEQEGAYVVTLYSEDEANNSNTNRAIKENGGITNSMPIEFLVDMTAPECIITGVAENERYRASERNIVIRYDDNTSVSALELYVNEQLVAQYDADELSGNNGELQYTAQADNDWQELRVVSTDAANNTSEFKSGRYLLTDNLWVQFINNVPLLAGSALAVALSGASVLLIRRRRRLGRRNIQK